MNAHHSPGAAKHDLAPHLTGGTGAPSPSSFSEIDASRNGSRCALRDVRGGPASPTEAAGASNRLTYVYRFAGYFQREPLAVFDNGQDAIDFAMAYNKARTVDGYISKGASIGDYAGDKPVGWLAAELSHRVSL